MKRKITHETKVQPKKRQKKPSQTPSYVELIRSCRECSEGQHDKCYEILLELVRKGYGHTQTEFETLYMLLRRFQLRNWPLKVQLYQTIPSLLGLLASSSSSKTYNPWAFIHALCLQTRVMVRNFTKPSETSFLPLSSVEIKTLFGGGSNAIQALDNVCIWKDTHDYGLKSKYAELLARHMHILITAPQVVNMLIKWKYMEYHKTIRIYILRILRTWQDFSSDVHHHKQYFQFQDIDIIKKLLNIMYGRSVPVADDAHHLLLDHYAGIITPDIIQYYTPEQLRLTVNPIVVNSPISECNSSAPGSFWVLYQMLISCQFVIVQYRRSIAVVLTRYIVKEQGIHRIIFDYVPGLEFLDRRVVVQSPEDNQENDKFVQMRTITSGLKLLSTLRY